MNRAATMSLLRPLVVEDRAKGMCEAGTGCPNPATDLHHVLPRSRARHGDVHLLDAWATQELRDGRTPDLPWLLALCQRCHTLAHGNPAWAESMGMYARGYVTTEQGRPRYVGGWPPLVAMFGEVPA